MITLAETANKIFTNYKVKDIVINQYKSLQYKDTIKDAIKIILSSQHRMILVYNKTSIIGWITKKHIVQALQKNDEMAAVSEYISGELQFIDAFCDLHAARKLLAATTDNILIVLENNQVIGIIDKENLDELLLFVTAKKEFLQL